MKRLNKKGFTMAELLIVVAIIAVLVAIAIPVFSAQLHKAQDQTEIANARSIYAELQADFLTNQGNSSYSAKTTSGTGGDTTFDAGSGTITFKNGKIEVTFDNDKGYKVVWHADASCSAGNTDMTFGQ